MQLDVVPRCWQCGDLGVVQGLGWMQAARTRCRCLGVVQCLGFKAYISRLDSTCVT